MTSRSKSEDLELNVTSPSYGLRDIERHRIFLNNRSVTCAVQLVPRTPQGFEDIRRGGTRRGPWLAAWRSQRSRRLSCDCRCCRFKSSLFLSGGVEATSGGASLSDSAMSRPGNT